MSITKRLAETVPDHRLYHSGPTRGIRDGTPTTLGRRSFVRGAAVGFVGMAVTAQMPSYAASSSSHGEAEFQQRAIEAPRQGTRSCWPTSRGRARTTTTAAIDLEVGNTEVLAGMIRDLHSPVTSTASNPSIPIPTTTRRPSRGTSGNRTPMPVRPSPTRWPRSSATTSCCWEARSGTSGHP